MANPSSDHTPSTITANTQAIQAQVEFALLDRLHLEDDSPYAWQSLESPPQLELDFTLNDDDLGWTEASIEAGAHRFFSTLDRLWETQTASMATTTVPLDRVRSRFGARVPADLLDTILNRVTDLTGNLERSGQAAIAQLVSCVDGAIPGWSSDDWRTIARPYALAMRDHSTRSTVCEEVAWDELSKIERAKLSLEITLAALEELQLENMPLAD